MYDYKTLDGFTYHVATQPTAYLREWLEKEWVKDVAEHPDQPWTTEWLHAVRTLEFRLEEIDLDAVRPRAELMDWEKEGYSFRQELDARVEERLEAMRMGTSVMPLVIRAADKELMDGYTRYVALKQLGAKRAYAYVGYPQGA